MPWTTAKKHSEKQSISSRFCFESSNELSSGFFIDATGKSGAPFAFFYCCQKYPLMAHIGPVIISLAPMDEGGPVSYQQVLKRLWKTLIWRIITVFLWS